MKFMLDDEEMDGQLQRSVIAAYSGAVDIGKTVVTACKATIGDYNSWHDVWSALARKRIGGPTKAQETGTP